MDHEFGEAIDWIRLEVSFIISITGTGPDIFPSRLCIHLQERSIFLFTLNRAYSFELLTTRYSVLPCLFIPSSYYLTVYFAI